MQLDLFPSAVVNMLCADMKPAVQCMTALLRYVTCVQEQQHSHFVALCLQLVTAKMQKDQRKQKASRNKPAAKRTGGSVSDRKQHQASKFGHICRSSPVEGFTGGPAEAQAQVCLCCNDYQYDFGLIWLQGRAPSCLGL